jgi:hypothetical protein
VNAVSVVWYTLVGAYFIFIAAFVFALAALVTYLVKTHWR